MKDCLIIGPETAEHYNQIYELLRAKVLRIGVWCVKWLLGKGPNAIAAYWYTTLKVERPEEKKLVLTKTYNEQDYPTYDNYPAIECNKNKNIPTDYYGKIGVPISFFKYYPELDYEVIERRGDLVLNGKKLFQRLIIQKRPGNNNS